MVKTDCAFGHSIESNQSPLGGVLFSATKSPERWIELFEKLKNAMKIKLPRGGKEVEEGNYQLLDDYLAREYPQISSGQQDQAVFMPEYFLSHFPKVVDHKPENQASSLPVEEIEKLSKSKGNCDGDETERILYERLQYFFLKSNQVTEKKTVVIHSFCDRYREGEKPQLELEADFLIINEDHKMIICIECKTTGTASACSKGVSQLKKMKIYFEKKIPVQNSWTFFKGFFTQEFVPHDAEVIREFELLRLNT